MRKSLENCCLTPYHWLPSSVSSPNDPSTKPIDAMNPDI